MAESRHSATSGEGRLDLAPSNPLAVPRTSGGLPQGSDSIYFSDRMFRDILGPIPNLQAGYLYSFGNERDRAGRLTLDYLLPLRLGSDSAVFGQAHGEFTNFWRTLSSIWRRSEKTPPTITTTTTTTLRGFNERADLSFGGGYRKIFEGTTLLGVNGFYDATKLGNTWYNSGGAGLEFATLLPGHDALDLTFNWYGNLFRIDVLAGAFRRGPRNYDVQVGYSHELWHGGPDCRLHATGYRFSSGSGVYGWRAGGELKTRNGVFSVKYEAGRDRINSTYHTVGGFVNVGFEPGNLLSGRNPLVLPEPIFRSPRNLRNWLTRKVPRTYFHRRAAVRVASAAVDSDRCVFPITRHISDTGSVTGCSDFFVPFDDGGVSAECLARAGRAEVTGYTVIVSDTAVVSDLQLAQDFGTAAVEWLIIYNYGTLYGPPLVFNTAPHDLAAMGASAEGFLVYKGGSCAHSLRIIDMTITFYE